MNELQNKMNGIIWNVANQIAERDDLIRCVAIALLSKKNLFILGDTGQAKSYVITQFCRQITGVRQFTYQVSKQTTEEQLFGRPDLSSLIPGSLPEKVLMEDAEYAACRDRVEKLYVQLNQNGCDRSLLQQKLNLALEELELSRRTLVALKGNTPSVITSGKIPESDIVFLDELFKSGESLLDSLLMCLNERLYINEGRQVIIPTISFFAASNEIPNFNNPEEAGLRPLYDRLDLKLRTQYIQDKDNRQRVLADKQNFSAPCIQTSISLEDLVLMQKEVAAVHIPDSLNDLADQILCELRANQIHVSDRRFFGFYPIVQAEAWLSGRDEAIIQDLSILRYYFWNDEEEIDKVADIIRRMTENPLGPQISECETNLILAAEEFENTKDSSASRAIIQLRARLTGIYRKIKELGDQAVSASDQDTISSLLSRAESINRAAHEFSKFTYVSLSELMELQ